MVTHSSPFRPLEVYLVVGLVEFLPFCLISFPVSNIESQLLVQLKKH